MKTIFTRFFSVCSKTGEFRRFKPARGLSRFLFPITGLVALLWVLFRVLPKPSRATYPCMRVAMPVASGFVAYLVGLVTTAFAVVKAKRSFEKSRYILASVFVLLGVGGSFLALHNSNRPVQAEYATTYHVPNDPIGEAKGIFPGRVVWAHNPDATNENCDPGAYGHGWFLDENNNQQVIDKMLSDAIKAISDQSNEGAAWEAIFAYHNTTRGKGAINYAQGEKVFIKTNATSSWSGNYNPWDLSVTYNASYGISETSPHLVLAVLRQLVNIVGVAQEDIYIGDPMKHIYKHCYDLWHPEFPNVHYLDHDDSADRERAAQSSSARIYYSDRGSILRTGTWSDASAGDPVTEDYLYTVFEEAEYVLNIPTLKGHKHAGITMFAKNHFGSQTREDAKHLHGGLVAPEHYNPRRQGYGLYRVQVDLMGHELLSGKNLMYLMDGLWPSDYEIDQPDKWAMAPFNNDWMSSIFLSLDPIAIESVGFDFLRTEFTVERGLATYPQMEGVDDYLHQAADSSNWPDDIDYDPENDGTLLPSLGVHEHWNNATAKQYSRNLGTGDGIELLTISQVTSVTDNEDNPQVANQFVLYPNYPNPFNPVTNIRYEITSPAHVELNIYNIQGQLMTTLVNSLHSAGEYTASWNGMQQNGHRVPSGIYVYHIQIKNDSWIAEDSQKMFLIE